MGHLFIWCGFTVGEVGGKGTMGTVYGRDFSAGAILDNEWNVFKCGSSGKSLNSTSLSKSGTFFRYLFDVVIK